MKDQDVTVVGAVASPLVGKTADFFDANMSAHADMFRPVVCLHGTASVFPLLEVSTLGEALKAAERALSAATEPRTTVVVLDDQNVVRAVVEVS